MRNQANEDKLFIEFLVQNNLLKLNDYVNLTKEAEIKNLSPIYLGLKNNLFNENEALTLLSEKLNIPILKLSESIIDKNAVALVDASFASYNDLIPIKIDNNELLVSIFNPFKNEIISYLEEKLKIKIKLFLGKRSDIIDLINKFYYQNSKALVKFDSYTYVSKADKANSKLIHYDATIKLLNFLEQTKVFNASVISFLIDEAEKNQTSPDELLNQEALVDILSALLGLNKVELDGIEIEKEVIALLDYNFAIKNTCLPIKLIKRTLTLAVFNPFQYETIIEAEKLTGYSVKIVLATKFDILAFIETFYHVEHSMDTDLKVFGIDDIVSNSGISDEETSIKIEDKVEDISEISHEDTPIVKMVNYIISQAIKEKTSDIHIEPTETSVIVRNRLDGVLHEVVRLQKYVQSAIISRIKILSKLDITEKRIPQDGKINLKFEGKDVNIRVSTLPTNYGETLVLRILDSSGSQNLSLDALGFSEDNLKTLKEVISQPKGIILVTGPTGSGKSSTLYACLKELNDPEVNIITVEDPIEYTLQGINQVQINKKAGLTFSSSLRAILRQDPDIIMVGEIRDTETAEIALNAAMTGHLVLSTLHTNDSISSITRLLDLNIPPFLISSSLLLVMAQRLLRKNCTSCLAEYRPSEDLIARVFEQTKEMIFKKGLGCPKCKNTGYKGRLGVYELLLVDSEVRKLIKDNVDEEQIYFLEKQKNMTFILDDALEKVGKGLTTLEEALRILGTLSSK